MAPTILFNAHSVVYTVTFNSSKCSFAKKLSNLVLFTPPDESQEPQKNRLKIKPRYRAGITAYMAQKMIESRAKNIYKDAKRDLGHKITMEEAIEISHNRFDEKCFIMTEFEESECRKEFYEELKRLNKEHHKNLSDEEIRKAVEQWDPSEIRSEEYYAVGEKKKSSEYILNKLVKGKFKK